MNNKWIPINKRLPIYGKTVLVAVTYKNDTRNIPNQIRVARKYNGDKWSIQ